MIYTLFTIAETKKLMFIACLLFIHTIYSKLSFDDIIKNNEEKCTHIQLTKIEYDKHIDIFFNRMKQTQCRPLGNIDKMTCIGGDARDDPIINILDHISCGCIFSGDENGKLQCKCIPLVKSKDMYKLYKNSYTIKESYVECTIYDSGSDVFIDEKTCHLKYTFDYMKTKSHHEKYSLLKKKILGHTKLIIDMSIEFFKGYTNILYYLSEVLVDYLIVLIDIATCTWIDL